MNRGLELQGINPTGNTDDFISRLVGQQYAYRNVVDFLEAQRNHTCDYERLLSVMQAVYNFCKGQVETIDNALDNMKVRTLPDNMITSAREYYANKAQ